MPASPKDQFIAAFTAEHETTLRVVKAFPREEADFRPHPRSKKASELVANFVQEQGLIMAAFTDQLRVPLEFPPLPEDMDALVEQFESDFETTRQILEDTPEEAYFSTATFFTGPGEVGPVPKLQLAWLMLLDQVHHRGQLSVYLRMAGGKVPSIYGPSADEPWD